MPESPPADDDSYVEDEKGCVMLAALVALVTLVALVGAVTVGFYLGTRVGG